MLTTCALSGLLVAGGFATLDFAIGKLASSGRAVGHTTRIVGSAHAVEGLAVDAEAAARGFFITRQMGYLRHFRAATAELPAVTAGLARLVRGNPGEEQQARLISAEARSFATDWALPFSRVLAAASPSGKLGTAAVADGERRLEVLARSSDA